MINLLPSQEKKRAYNELKKRTLVTLMFFLVIFLIFLSATFYGLKCYSLKVLEKEKKMFLQEKQQYLDVIDKREDIKEINNLTNKINEFKNSLTDFNVLFTKINSIVLNDNTIKEIQYQNTTKGDNQIILKGKLSDWEDLVKLEEDLEREFSEVKFSSESWTQTKNINFMVKFVSDD